MPFVDFTYGSFFRPENGDGDFAAMNLTVNTDTLSGRRNGIFAHRGGNRRCFIEEYIIFLIKIIYTFKSSGKNPSVAVFATDAGNIEFVK